MPDLESRLPEMLRRTAPGASPDPTLERRVLHRSRRRRIVNASVAGLAALAIVAGMVVGAEGLLRSDRTTVGHEGETSSPSPGAVEPWIALPGAVWPEVDRTSLETAQARADAGELGWRLDPVETAAAFAVNVLDWHPTDVETRPTHGPGSAIRIVISNRGLAAPSLDPPQPAPQTLITLEQLGTQGQTGIWTVTGADSDLIELDPLAFPPARAIFQGRLVDTIAEWVPGAWPMDPTGIRTDANDGYSRAADQTFRAWTEIPTDLLPATGSRVVGILVGLWDPEGTIVAADAFAFAVTPESGSVAGASGATGVTGATGPIGGQVLPSAVLGERDAISNAVATQDFDALEMLIDPNHFAYNFSDGSNPVPEWRKDRAPLEALATILEMPFTTTEGTPDLGTIYLWPSLVDADLTNLTPDERAMLDKLGITDKDVKDMLDAFGGYVGPRTGIAEDGTWVFFTIGGD